MMIESLENRRLLTSTLVNGKLTLTSRVFGDSFLVQATDTEVTVSIVNEGFNFAYPRGSVKQLEIDSASGGGPDRAGDYIFVDSTLNFPTTVVGSIGDDTILAGNGNTVVSGGVGADIIIGGNGNDTISGGDGRAQRNGIDAADDSIFGGPGNDSLMGDGGPSTDIGDIISGGDGDDTIIGGDGPDLMDGGNGVDVLSYQDKTGDGANVVFDTPTTGVGNPTYNAPRNTAYDPNAALSVTNYPYLGFGAVTQQDTVYVVSEHDQLLGGLDAYIATLPDTDSDGIRDFNYAQILARFTLLNNDNFESFLGGPGMDLFDVHIKSANYTLSGGDALDTLIGGDGDDLLLGGNNVDPGRGGINQEEGIDGGAGNDTILGGEGSNNMDGGLGNDSIVGGSSGDILHGGLGDDYLDGQGGSDLMAGDNGNGDPSTLSSAGGNDTLVGGLEQNGADTLQGDGGFDIADYSARTRGIALSFDIEHDDGNPTINGGLGERDFVTQTTEEAIGGSGNDTLGSGPDGIGRLLDGGAGNDRLISGPGPDTLIGGAGGADSVDYSARSSTTTITVTFDNLANDGDPNLLNGGPAGENDNVSSTVENVVKPGETPENPVEVTPPIAPSAVHATAISFNQVNVSWTDNSDNETGFELWRKTGPGGSYTLITTTRANIRQYNGDKTVVPDTTYYYRVRAFNASGNSLFSEPAKVITPSTVVTAPSTLRASPISSTRIDLTFRDNSSTETNFEVWRSTSGGSYSLVATIAAGSTGYSDTGLSPGTTYSYQVRGTNAFRDSDFSNVASATTRDASFVVAPSGLVVNRSASKGLEGNVLSWSDNSTNESSFSIERVVAGSSSFAAIGSAGVNATTFRDTTADAGVIYVYRVRAIGSLGNSAYSNLATSDVNRALAAPTRLEALSVAPSRIVLNWIDNALVESGYSIERRFGQGDDFVKIATVSAGSTTYTDNDLIPNSDYQYRIRAVGNGQSGAYSNVASERTVALLASVPRTPSAFKARALSETVIRLDWHDNANNESSYAIERATSLSGPFVTINTVPADTTTYKDSGLAAGASYYYRVRAIDGTTRSATTAIVKASTLAPSKVSISASELAVSEGDVGTFTLRRKGGSFAGELTIRYAVSGTAKSGADYSPLRGIVTFAAGAATAKVTLSSKSDSEDEGPESVIVTLKNGAAYNVSPSMKSAEIDIDTTTSAQSIASASPAPSIALRPASTIFNLINRVAGSDDSLALL